MLCKCVCAEGNHVEALFYQINVNMKKRVSCSGWDSHHGISASHLLNINRTSIEDHEEAEKHAQPPRQVWLLRFDFVCLLIRDTCPAILHKKFSLFDDSCTWYITPGIEKTLATNFFTLKSWDQPCLPKNAGCKLQHQESDQLFSNPQTWTP